MTTVRNISFLKDMRIIFALLLLLGCSAQTLPEIDEIPSEILDHLETQGRLDYTRAWALDTGRTNTLDLLVQESFAYPQGGNATNLRHFLFFGDLPPTERFEFVIPVGIETLRREGPNLIATLYVYEEGDGDGCPSRRRDMRLPF